MGAFVERAFPEQRLFLKSDTETRFVRLSPTTQLVAISGSALVVGWTIVASAIVMMDTIGSGSLREQAAREQQTYEQRLNALAKERDANAENARDAISRFNAALGQVSEMQTALLASETRRREAETGVAAAQDTLRKVIKDRDAAQTKVASLRAELDGEAAEDDKRDVAQLETTLDFMTAALSDTAGQRDALAAEAEDAEAFAEKMILEARLKQERNDRIFSQLEDAVTVSVKPLDKMFESAGLDPDQLISTVRRGYSGQGGPLTPLSLSTKGEGPDADGMRANSILERLDEMNLYRIAAQKAPFSIPLKSSFRFTSGFGKRWGRMHEGTDFAAPHGTPIYATADGVVTHAGWMSGYGRLVKIQHEFGIETRYAHQSQIRVKVGQRVSRGERIGDMGNSGRSTGTHLHYEVRVNGKPVNPMTYIKAARDVF
ncbi:Murein DD-endopeptidase MepM and murein hydrolase activator NlpD, contain LysM domain [Tranquillimonas rosea]|uniref:Murein DD-endopeptidase MepM and murein hydrolase activator NlpD, contain LysM domain n=1 Tax=Tranquillimonas rosea TaxID=641238 RepID=A0A1H9TLD0_9RHOB|nr:M23 family metallopeptidase [Tranquillimonas rosea]SER97847.1 Murein DD-endopeptidase MepM and murein hydrolase activator NlpD, contain LysM domain [Tranquillimonas rosea]